MFDLRWHRRNVALHSAVEACWGTGMGFVGFQTILPVFLVRLGGGPGLVGLLPALWCLGIASAQLVVPALTAHRERRKGLVVALHFVAILPYGTAAVLFCSPAGAHLPPGSALAAFLVLFAVYALIIGCTYPPWADYLARSTLPERRGGGMGAIFFFQTVASAAGAGAASLVLGSAGPFPRSYGLCFAAFFAVTFAGNFFLIATRERPGTAEERPGLVGGARGVLSLAVAPGPFRSYLLARALTEGWPLVTSFFTVLAARELGVGGETAARLAAVLFVAQAAGNPLLGRGLWAFYAASAFFGLFSAAFNVANLNLVMGFAPGEDKTRHIVAATVVMAPLQAAVALLGGAAVAAFGFRPVWVVVIAATAVGAAALLRLPEPGRAAGPAAG